MKKIYNMDFRFDLNALRAFSVISVVLYHFYPQQLIGGFIGVDVFFVISGYLMTKIISETVIIKKFSYFNFCKKRFSRIVPPFVFFLIAIYAFGYCYLAPFDFRILSRDLVASSLFLSNFIFAFKIDYFGADDNFLLHTWSLSSEWQFYLLYPILLIYLIKSRTQEYIYTCLMILTTLFLCVSLVYGYFDPQKSYYLLIARAWEMLIGGAVLFKKNLYSERINNVLFRLGWIILVLSVVFIDSSGVWPRMITLAPILGACLVIYSGSKMQESVRLFCNNVFVYKVGRWSYSIYLWHWPLVVAFSYFMLDGNFKIIGVILSVFLGYLSFTIIECNSNRPILVKITVVGSCILLSLSLYTYFNNGLPTRFNDFSSPLIQGGTNYDGNIQEGTITSIEREKAEFVMVGDSYASHYLRGMISNGNSIKISWFSSCLSLPGVISKRKGFHSGWKEACSENYKNALIGDEDIILSQLWIRDDDQLECVSEDCLLTGSYYRDLEIYLPKLFEQYVNADKDVFVIGMLPIPDNTKQIKCLRASYLTSLDFQCEYDAQISERVLKVNSVISRIVSNYKRVYFINPMKDICKEKECSFFVDKKSIFTDDYHLSSFGSTYVWPKIVDEINMIKQRNDSL